jgi:integrase/recombinase XerD
MQERIESWLAGIASLNTQQAYRRDLEVFVDWLDDAGVAAHRVTATDVDGFRLACEAAGSSTATVRRRLAAVSSFYRSLGGGAAANPVGSVERPRRESDDPSAASSAEVLEPGSMAALWDAANDAGGKTAVLLSLLLFDGFTTPRMLRIDVADIELGRAPMSIADEGVRIVVDARTALAVRSYLGSRRTGPLLLGDRTVGAPERLTRFGVDYLVKQVGRRAGLEPGLTVTTVRRSVARAAASTGDAVQRHVEHRVDR